jgi:large subunit ribosomal protein L23
MFDCDKLCIGEVDQMVMHVLFVAHDYRRNSVIDFIVEAVGVCSCELCNVPDRMGTAAILVIRMQRSHFAQPREHICGRRATSSDSFESRSHMLIIRRQYECAWQDVQCALGLPCLEMSNKKVSVKSQSWNKSSSQRRSDHSWHLRSPRTSRAVRATIEERLERRQTREAWSRDEERYPFEDLEQHYRNCLDFTTWRRKSQQKPHWLRPSRSAQKKSTCTASPAQLGIHISSTNNYKRPNFHITLHRTPKQPANFASFTVPLWFSKLDIRDYLFHAYNVRINGVRSYVKLQRVTQGKPFKVGTEDYSRPQYKRWHRPPSIKKMTVELERPFVWPEALEDMSDFSQETVQNYEKETKAMQDKQSSVGDTMVNEERRVSMREQAKALLEGKAKWKPVDQRFAR